MVPAYSSERYCYIGDYAILKTSSLSIAIVLDPGNPSMKALAAAETNPGKKPFKQKDPDFKKRKIETPPGTFGGPPKSAYKPGFPSATTLKGRPSVSPLHSPPELSVPPASPFGAGNLTKGHTNVEDVMSIHVSSKENATNSEKEMPNRANSGALLEKPGRKGNLGAKPMDMQSMLISLLLEKPEGMSVKALEKAVGDTIPTSIIKKIATFQAPGRYILKPGVEVQNYKKPLSENGSSPDYLRHPTPAPEDKHNDIFAPTPNSAEKASPEELEKQAHLESNNGEDLDPFAKINIQHHVDDLFREKKVSDNSEGQAGSSSDSGSDSDSESDSSDSGSDSGSRSKSKSPVGSGSKSSSDSESDASSNSKQGSDEDVDIMTSDDDKESKPKLQTCEPGFSTSPTPWRTPDVGVLPNGIHERQDGSGSGLVEIEKDLPVDAYGTEMAVSGNSVSNIQGEIPVEDIRLYSPDYQEHQESQVYIANLFGERENIDTDGFKNKKTESSERISKGKSKRGSHSEQLHEKSEYSKRLKVGSLLQPKISRGRESLFRESPKILSPERVSEDNYNGHSTETLNRGSRNENDDSGLQKGYIQGIHSISASDYQESGRKAADISARVKVTDTAERPGIHTESLGRGIKYSETTHKSQESLPAQKDRLSKEIQDEGCNTQERKMPRSSKEGAFGDKHSSQFDSYNYGRHGEPGGKLKQPREVSNSHMGFSPQDNNRNNVERFPIINAGGKILQRELSELELGELREPLPEETPGAKKKFERKGSFKQSENKPSTSDDWNSEKSKVKRKTVVDSGKLSPPKLRVGPSRNAEGSSKRTPEQCADDLTGPQHRVVQSQAHGLQHQSWVDRSEGTQKSTDVSGKVRHNEARASQGNGLEGFGETHKEASVNALQRSDTKQGPVSHLAKESKTQRSNTVTGSSDKRKDTSVTENNEGGPKRRESSSDDNCCSYSKYEKEQPELREPIKNISQYKEYVQEYREKYDSYCSLNKTLENYRNEFHKLGRDLENAKGKDMEKYHSILGKLRESYRQCGTSHKRLKKIFIVLHEELQHLKQMIKDYAVSNTRN
ncbi:uncharacterized protein LOC131299223 isoform X4 [Rhododendron vialii]|uniref:uncharacterized protein LOC131299223 isoform X4 n=1 Tax=Rhododendron vialii TaxID=182163 RepID=UPI00265ECB69|nr:uncharacterized protein LOC131299223 isoform X4 [Rhododendron vialii]